MATLNNTRISDTYFGLIKTIDNAVISATLKELTDGSGNQTGLYINNAGDFKVNSVLEFGSLKDTGENITITKFVDEADGIANNDNDTTIPTSAAVKDYVDNNITIQDLDFRGDDNAVFGDVDLDSESFQILGTAGEIETAVVSAGGTQLRIGIVTNPTLSGNVTITGDLNISQGEIINIGSDFDLYETASGAYIQYASNPVIFNGDSDVIFRKKGSEEKTAVFTPQGSAKLYHNNNLKLETTANGFNVTGKISNLTDPTANQDAATKAYVDSLDAGSDLDFSGDSGTGDVNLNAQTFAVTGVTNELQTTASGQGLSIGFKSTGVVLPNNSTATTQATSDDSTKIATTAYVKSLNNASDLDFSDGSNTGAVVLNSQTFSIIGTANEVETSASNQQLQIGLPSSINVNSASATILQTARDISLTGEASATISSFNGSSNVSGAVTLDNNSVTGKVLTGLASPTASNILASDSILEAFGKTQSQLNTLAGGLRFMGTWNANTNTPTLTSGGGEADSGTTTGTTTNKLIDSSQNFTSTVTNGDKVINQASGATALVTNVDSNTSLTLDADIMVSGQEYTIDNSPFITQGHYFVVSVGGTSSLNGLSNWAVGDWVIAGAGNVWEKLDHTQVDGTGTAGNIAKFSSTNVIADSIMAESGSTINVTGTVDASQQFLVGGNDSIFAENNIRFKSSGAAFIDHNTTSQSIKFRLSNSSALDTTTLELTPTYSVFEGNVTANSGNITIGGKTYPKLLLNDNQGVARSFSVGTDNETFTVRNETGSTNPLTILGSDNSATFAGKVGIGSAPSTRGLEVSGAGVLGTILASDGTVNTVLWGDASGSNHGGVGTDNNYGFNIYQNGGVAIEIDTSKNATFAGDVTLSAAGSTGEIIRTTDNTEPYLALQRNSGNNGVGVLRLLDGGDLTFDTGATGAGQATRLTIDGSTGNATFTGNVAIQSTIPKLSFTDLQQDDWDIINDNGEFKFLCSTGSGVALQLNTNNNATFAGNVKIADEKIFGLRTSSNDYGLQYRDLDFRLIGSADGSTQRQFSFGYYTSDNPAGTWNGKTYINSYTGQTVIGNTSIPADHLLQISNSGQTYSRFALTNSSTGNASGDGLKFQMEGLNSIIKNQESGYFAFGTAGRETDLRISDGGNVSMNYVNDNIYTYGSGAYSGKLIVKADSTSDVALACINRNTSGSTGGNEAVSISFVNEFVTNQFNWLGKITAAPTDSWTGTASTRSAAMIFSTNNGGTQSEKLRIAPDGKLGVNTSSFAPTITDQIKLGNMGSGAVGEVFDANVVDGAARMILAAGGNTGQVPIISLRHYSAAYGIDLWMGYSNPWNTYIDNRHPSSGFIFRNNCNADGSEDELMHITSSGTIISSKDGAGLQTNLLLSNLNDTNGDAAGIGFSMLNNNTYVKAGIFFERTTTQGRGSLIFATNNEVNGNNVTLSDERMRITSGGDVGIGTDDGPGDVNAKLHVYKQSGDNTVNELLRLDCGENNHNVGKGGAIVFRDINVYTDTAKIIAQRIGNTGGSTLQFALRNAEIMRLKSDGKINIGTSTNFHQFEPEADMDFNFIMNAGQINASPNYTIKTSTSGGAITSRLQLIGSTGNMTITGSLTQNGSISDISLKENIKPVENALDKIEKLNAVSFDWKKSDSILQLKEDYGFIAQEVAEVIPEIVRTNTDDKKVINYNGITSVLVKAIQELKAEVDSLKKQCNCK